MTRYKILENESPTGVSTSILNKDTGVICPKCIGNKEYDQFIQDAKTIGIASCIEGPTVGVTTAYTIARQAEYPSIEDQLDKIYHSGVNAWKADIKVIKDKYPKTQVGVTTVAAVPSWVQTDVYLTAKERLERPKIADGEKVGIGTEKYWNAAEEKHDVKVIYKWIYEPLPEDDPAVIIDNAERSKAQSAIDATPQSIIDANS